MPCTVISPCPIVKRVCVRVSTYMYRCSVTHRQENARMANKSRLVLGMTRHTCDCVSARQRPHVQAGDTVSWVQVSLACHEQTKRTHTMQVRTLAAQRHPYAPRWYEPKSARVRHREASTRKAYCVLGCRPTTQQTKPGCWQVQGPVACATAQLSWNCSVAHSHALHAATHTHKHNAYVRSTALHQRCYHGLSMPTLHVGWWEQWAQVSQVRNR